MSRSHLSQSAFAGVLKFIGGCTATAVIAAAVVVGTTASNPQPAAASAAPTEHGVTELPLGIVSNHGSDSYVSGNRHGHGIRVVRIAGLGELFVDVRTGIQVTGTSLAVGATIEAVTGQHNRAVALIGGTIDPLRIQLSLTGERLTACFLSETLRTTSLEVAVDAGGSGETATADEHAGIDITGVVDVNLPVIDADTNTEDDGNEIELDVLVDAQVDKVVDLNATLGLGIDLGSKVDRFVEVVASSPSAAVAKTTLIDIATPKNVIIPVVSIPKVEATVETVVSTDSVWTCSESHGDHTIDVTGNDDADESGTDTATDGSEAQVKAVAITPSATVAGSGVGGGQTTTPTSAPPSATNETGTGTSDNVDAIHDTQVVDDITDDNEDDSTDGSGHDGHDHSHGLLDCLPSIELDLFAGIGLDG